MTFDESTSDTWSWLAGTFWYVPAETMLAIRMVDLRQMRTRQVQDQTLWFIERSDSGYLIGRTALSLNGGAFSYATMVGSVTPSGDVLLSFAPVDPVSLDPETGVEAASLTIGTGKMVQYRGNWAFLMQMSSGTGAMSLSHWSYMLQSTPDDPSWTAIPGVPGTSIGAVFAASATSGT
jgi:hypothetical protein